MPIESEDESAREGDANARQVWVPIRQDAFPTSASMPKDNKPQQAPLEDTLQAYSARLVALHEQQTALKVRLDELRNKPDLSGLSLLDGLEAVRKQAQQRLPIEHDIEARLEEVRFETRDVLLKKLALINRFYASAYDEYASDKPMPTQERAAALQAVMGKILSTYLLATENLVSLGTTVLAGMPIPVLSRPDYRSASA